LSPCPETALDVAVQYIETPIGSRTTHTFLHHTQTTQAYRNLPSKTGTLHDAHAQVDQTLKYLIVVYVDDFIGLAIPTTCEQLDHVANSVMCRVHDVFLPHDSDRDDLISFKKRFQGDDTWDEIKELLGFVFNGTDKKMWLTKLSLVLIFLIKIRFR
jgi:hypothetical protein